jgi:hypothetical protein
MVKGNSWYAGKISTLFFLYGLLVAWLLHNNGSQTCKIENKHYLVSGQLLNFVWFCFDCF